MPCRNCFSAHKRHWDFSGAFNCRTTCHSTHLNCNTGCSSTHFYTKPKQKLCHNLIDTGVYWITHTFLFYHRFSFSHYWKKEGGRFQQTTLPNRYNHHSNLYGNIFSGSGSFYTFGHHRCIHIKPHKGSPNRESPFLFVLRQDKAIIPIGREMCLAPRLLGYCVKKASPFFLSKELQKEPKTALKKFRLCGGDQGRCPWNLQTFEKVWSKLSWEVDQIRSRKKLDIFHVSIV